MVNLMIVMGALVSVEVNISMFRPDIMIHLELDIEIDRKIDVTVIAVSIGS